MKQEPGRKAFRDAIKKLIFVGILLISFSAHSHAGTYYVSPSGSASWSACTAASTPCSATTAMSNAAAGDTVIFLAGTYTPPYSGSWNVPDFNPAHSGTSGSPITFKANPGSTVTIVPSASRKTNNGYMIGASGRDYIVWDGFVIDTTTMTALCGGAIFNSCSHGTVKNCRFLGHTGTVADNNPLIRLQSSSYILIQNNVLRDQRGQDYNSTGVQNYYSSNCTIENNEVYNCVSAFNEKNSATPAYTQTYRFNLVHDCGYGIQGPGNASTNILDIYQNIFYNITNTVLDIEKDWPNSFFRNNTVYNYSKGFNFWSIVTSNTSLSVYNNIFHTASSNNVIYHGTGLGYDNYNTYYNNGSSINFQLNSGSVSFSSWKSSTGFDASSITTDPLFVNAANHDFRLQKGSPALTGGRGGGYPSVLGAYITGNEVIGTYAATNPPAASVPASPLSLTVR